MKRDMGLIRKILLEIESWPDAKPKGIDIDGVDKDILNRHIEYLHQAQLIQGNIHNSSRGHGVDRVSIIDMSWEGQDFLASLKNDSVWKRITNSFSAAELATMPFSVMKDIGIALLKDWAKKKVGL